jgi:hypothetical protein
MAALTPQTSARYLTETIDGKVTFLVTGGSDIEGPRKGTSGIPIIFGLRFEFMGILSAALTISAATPGQ